MAAWSTRCRGESCTKNVGLHGARGLCPTHYSRWRKYGDPDTVYEAVDVLERLWVRTERQGECLVFTGAISSTGYGSIRGGPDTGFKGFSTHAIVCEAFHGPRPSPDHEVLHSCDNRPCVEPTHLRWGTPQQNTRDCIERGRFKPPSRSRWDKRRDDLLKQQEESK